LILTAGYGLIYLSKNSFLPITPTVGLPGEGRVDEKIGELIKIESTPFMNTAQPEKGNGKIKVGTGRLRPALIPCFLYFVLNLFAPFPGVCDEGGKMADRPA
jgi:hypothetical protein